MKLLKLFSVSRGYFIGVIGHVLRCLFLVKLISPTGTVKKFGSLKRQVEWCRIEKEKRGHKSVADKMV